MNDWPAPHPDDLPYLTADLPGIGGEIKQRAEDFVVEEIPAYQPCGEGTHVYFFVEKSGLTTFDLVNKVAERLGKPSRDIGFAGLKDARAVTRQWLSVEHIEPERVKALEFPNAKVLDVSRHGNKLKLGHLRGNKFTIRVRGSDDADGARASEIMAVLAKRGMPNYFGAQRFGVRGDNAFIGRAVLLGDFESAMAIMLGWPGKDDHGDIRRARQLYDEGKLAEARETWPYTSRQQKRVLQSLIKMRGNAKRAWRTVEMNLRRLMVSAFQSQLFNEVLADRIGELDRLVDGDIAMKHLNGACFVVEDAAGEQGRCDAFEISPTGPIFGHKVKRPTGPTRVVEDRVLGASGVGLEAFRVKDGMKFPGERRALRVCPADASVAAGSDQDGVFVALRFTLPPGCYATCVTREVCKYVD